MTKKVMYALILPLVVVSGLVFANRAIRNDPAEKPGPVTERKGDLEEWKTSPEGVKVLAGAAKIHHQVKTSGNMEAVITSLSLPPGSRLGFGVMARINGDDYILSFGPENSNEFKQLRRLKVNDKIVIRSHVVSYAPKYSYPIISGDYVEHDRKVMYRRAPRKGGC